MRTLGQSVRKLLWTGKRGPGHDELQLFHHFEGMYLNSHGPILGQHLKMYERFEPIQARLIGVRLSAKQMIDILSAK